MWSPGARSRSHSPGGGPVGRPGAAAGRVGASRPARRRGAGRSSSSRLDRAASAAGLRHPARGRADGSCRDLASGCSGSGDDGVGACGGRDGGGRRRSGRGDGGVSATGGRDGSDGGGSATGGLCVHRRAACGAGRRPAGADSSQKKSKTGCIVGAIIGALLLRCIVSSAIGIPMFIAAQSAAEQQKALETANAAFDKGATDVNSAMDKLSAADPAKTEAAKLAPTLDQAKKLSASAAVDMKVATARDGAARRLAGQGRLSGRARLDGQSAAASRHDGRPAADRGEADGRGLPRRQGVLGGHGGLMNAGTRAGNSRQYGTIRRRRTPRPAKQFTTAQNAYREAAKLDPAAGYDFGKEALQSELRLQQAQLSIRMAADGQAGRLDAL